MICPSDKGDICPSKQGYVCNSGDPDMQHHPAQMHNAVTQYLHAPLQGQTDLLFLARGFSLFLHPEGSSNF